jgi:putative OPT family oligopeptide transporter
MDEKNSFKPYVPAEKITPEFTVTAVIMGAILAIVFGAANAYLGLRVGMTVSASIPAAVISMGVIRFILKRDSILENNLVQTIGSAGESLAAGTIFTLPAMFLWANEGVMDKPSILMIAVTSAIGGILGVLFMVPLRNALIVKEHATLPYPEGKACAEVLLAGEESKESAAPVFVGLGLSAAIKFVLDGLKVIPGEIAMKFKGYQGEVGVQVYPAVFSVGYICGPKVSSYLFAGGLVSWMIFIPLIVLFGGDSTLYPGTKTIAEMYAAGGASAIWSSYIRYIGAGVLVSGGIISLIKSMPMIASTFKDSLKALKGNNDVETIRTNKNMNMLHMLIMIAAVVVIAVVVPFIPLSPIGAILVVVFGFFFAAVSSRMVAIVGSSNNPVSGMAIATLLFSTLILKALGINGADGMKAAIVIGTIICVIAAIAGDTSQDLKTGYLLGATPVKQQYGEIIGVIVSAVAVGFILYLLDAAWGFGSEELGAPQAVLMKMIVQGVMQGDLPWGLVFIGVCLGIVIEILGIPVLPFAIGTYLPTHITACIMCGGVVRWFFDRKKDEDKEEQISRGTLFASGLIAGEGIVGILLAVFAVAGVNKIIDLSEVLVLPEPVADCLAIVVMAIIICTLIRVAKGKKKA